MAFYTFYNDQKIFTHFTYQEKTPNTEILGFWAERKIFLGSQ